MTNQWNSFSSIHIILFVYQHLTKQTLILSRIKFMDKRKLNIATPTALPLWELVLLSCPQSIPWVPVSTFVSAQHFLPVETETRSTIVKLFPDSFHSWREWEMTTYQKYETVLLIIKAYYLKGKWFFRYWLWQHHVWQLMNKETKQSNVLQTEILLIITFNPGRQCDRVVSASD